jgi:uncharacterized protein (TIGR02271 family)
MEVLMNDVYVGMTVVDDIGTIGIVENVINETSGDGPRMLVRRTDGGMMTLMPGMYTTANNVVRIEGAETLSEMATDNTLDPHRTQVLPTTQAGIGRTTSSGSTGQSSFGMGSQTMEVAPGQEVRIPVIREEAIVQTRPVEGGGVRVHKTVNEREEVIQQPTYQEDIDVERVTVGRVVDVVPQVREEGDTLIIPVLEEMLVVEKRLVLKEEVRITRRRSQQTEEARVVLREEQVQIERIDERQAGL